MKLGINGRLGFGSTMSFENGWMIVIDQLPCGHLEITICPAHVVEDLKHLVKIGSQPEYSNEAMQKRGDWIPHFGGNDDALLEIIATVAGRENKPHLAGVLADIMKAGNRD